MKVKRRLIVLMLLLASCQTFSQVSKLHKNQLFPFDTGVAMELNFYRAIRIKSIECDSFILNSNKVIELKDSSIVVLNATVQAQEKYINKNKFIVKKAPYLLVLSFIIGLIL